MSSGESDTLQETMQLPLGTRAQTPVPIGPVLGRYLVIEELGRGGMGVVVRAYDPKLQREVALKMLRSDVMSDQTRLRMIREARAMAKLNHPNVVAIYDVEFDDEVVALAMEYVPGLTLRDWLQQPHDLADVFVAFVQAGRGLAAAHAEGLLHRDFKPANVLVGHAGDRMRVKVTDFGIARVDATAESSDANELVLVQSFSGSSTDPDTGALTQAGMVMGTPRYMAPEQHLGGELGPAADQYAFCIALWEALCGDAPFTGARIVDAKQSGPPPWPKGVVAPTGVVAALRRGLAADPGDRWPDMAQLLDAIDLRRRTGPSPSMLVGGTAIAAVAVGAGWMAWKDRIASRCSGAAAQLEQVWDDDRRNEVETALLATQATYAPAVWARIEPRLDAWSGSWQVMHTETCEATTLRGEQSDAVMDLRMGCLHRAKLGLRAVVDVLAQADGEVLRRAHALVDGLPSLSRCADVDALQSDVPPPDASEAEAVAQAREALDHVSALRTGGRPQDARAAIELADAALVGVTYEPVWTELELERGILLDDLAEYERSEAALHRAFELGARWDQWDLVARASTQLLVVVGVRRAHFAEAHAWAEVATAIVERHDDPVRSGTLHLSLGTLLQKEGKFAEAEAEIRVGLADRERVYGPDHTDSMAMRGSLASVLYLKGDLAAAEAEQRAVLEWRAAALGMDHPELAAAHMNLATMLKTRGALDEAERETRVALAGFARALAPDHPDIARGHNTLANIFVAKGRLADAESEYREALAIWERRVGPEHPEVALVHANIGGVLAMQGRYAEGEAETRRSLEIRLRLLGPDHPDVGNSRGNLGSVLKALGRKDEALLEIREALRILGASKGPDHQDTAIARTNLGISLAEMERYPEAVDELRGALATMGKALGPDHASTVRVRENLGTALSALERWDEAETELRAGIESLGRSVAAEHPELARCRQALAELLMDRERFTEALPLLEQAWKVRSGDDVSPHERGQTAATLARCLRALHRDPARVRELIEVAEQAYVATGPTAAAALAELRAWK